MNAMHGISIAAGATLALVVALAAPSHASEALAKKYACTACHATDERVVGPSFKEIAKRYAAERDAEATLAQTIRKGSVDKWGKVPMPANDALGEADAKTLAAWVLASGK
jgi:cytochrome c